MNSIAVHYDLLIENGNDPVLDGIELQNYMNQWDGETFLDKLNLSPDKVVLEIGCGTGRIAKKVVDFCRFYVGIDISPKTVAAARKHFVDKSNATFVCADFFDCDFQSKFDVIFSTLTFMHLKYKLKAIEKIFALLTLNGKIVLSVDKSRQNYIDTGYGKIRVYPDNPSKIRNFLDKTGFKNIQTTEIENAYVITASRI